MRVLQEAFCAEKKGRGGGKTPQKPQAKGFAWEEFVQGASRRAKTLLPLSSKSHA